MSPFLWMDFVPSSLLQTDKLRAGSGILSCKKEFLILFSPQPKKGPDFTHNAHPDFRLRQTRGLLIMWTVFIQEELANMTELTDGEKNLMLLVCLNEEIKESENTEFWELNTTERLPSLSSQ